MNAALLTMPRDRKAQQKARPEEPQRQGRGRRGRHGERYRTTPPAGCEGQEPSEGPVARKAAIGARKTSRQPSDHCNPRQHDHALDPTPGQLCYQAASAIKHSLTVEGIERERGLDEEAEMPRGALPLYTLITRWEAMRETLPSRWAPRLT